MNQVSFEKESNIRPSYREELQTLGMVQFVFIEFILLLLITVNDTYFRKASEKGERILSSNLF